METITTLEQSFFKGFSYLMDECLNQIQDKYWFNQIQMNESYAFLEDDCYADAKPQRIGFEDFIKSCADWFGSDCPLMEEIYANVKNLDGKEKECERYIYSLLIPFCRYGENTNGKAPKERAYEEARMYVEHYMPPNGKPTKRIIRYFELTREYIKSIDLRTQFYFNVISDTKNNFIQQMSLADLAKFEKDIVSTIERRFCFLNKVAEEYSIKLRVHLLERGINLEWYEHESEIYLDDYSNYSNYIQLEQYLEQYFGSAKLARKYIEEALPKIEPQQSEEAAQPKEEDTTGQAAEQPQQEQAQQDNATTTGATESEQQSTGTIQQEPILPSELDTTGQAGTEHQQEQAKPTRRRGRPRRTIKDHMKNDADGSKLQKLHAVLKGKSGKVVALTILTAIEKGWMDKPTYEEVKNEFGDIGSKAGYNRYFDKRMFTEEEITGALNSLK